MSMKKRKELFNRLVIYASIFFIVSTISGVDIGSDNAVTRFNNQVVVNNGDRIAGFAALDGGFFFSNANVTATFDSFFQVSGPLDFNGGTLNLNKDIFIVNESSITNFGNIVGASHSVDLAATITTLSVVDITNPCSLRFITEANGSSPFGAVSWAFDNTYIAIGTNSNPELLVYAFDGTALSLVDAVNPSGATRAINGVGWRPGQYYLAITRNSGFGAEFLMYSFNTGTETLTEIDADFHGGNGTALAWHPSGNYVVEGTDSNSEELILYTVNPGGTFGAIVTENISPNRDVQLQSLDFNDTGDYFAVGLNASGSDPTLLVYDFTPSPLGASVNASALTPQSVAGVSWNKVHTNLIAVGQAGTTGNRVIVYEHNGGAGTLTQVAAIADFSIAVESVQWNNSGDMLAVGTAASGGVGQLRTYCFDSATLTFEVANVFDRGSNVSSLSWSDNNTYLAVADDADFLSVYQRLNTVNHDFTLSNVNVILNNSLSIDNAGLSFNGRCVIDGNGNILDLSGTSTILVGANSSLLLRNMTLKSTGTNHIAGVDLTSTLSCENVYWLLDEDFSFTQGNLAAVTNLSFRGNAKSFTFQSNGILFIDAFTDLVIDTGMTFSYDPPGQADNLLSFFDDTARFVLDNGTLHAVSDLSLTKGSLFVNNVSVLSNEATTASGFGQYGITIGDESGNDFAVAINNGATLRLSQGVLSNRNMTLSNWDLFSVTSKLQIGSSTRLNLYTSLNLNNGFLVLEGQSILARAQNAQILGSLESLGDYIFARI